MIMCYSNVVKIGYNVCRIIPIYASTILLLAIQKLLTVESWNIPLLLKLSFSINNDVFKIFRIFIVYNNNNNNNTINYTVIKYTTFCTVGKSVLTYKLIANNIIL